MFDISRIIKAAKYSQQGFKVAWQEEKAFRDDVVIFVIGITIAIYFSNNIEQFVISLISLILLLITELLNSGLENLADRISTEYCEFCKAAKDLGSAAVCLMLVFIFMYHLFLIIY